MVGLITVLGDEDFGTSGAELDEFAEAVNQVDDAADKNGFEASLGLASDAVGRLIAAATIDEQHICSGIIAAKFNHADLLAMAFERITEGLF